MKRELTAAEKAELLPKIEAVLNGGPEWEDENAHYPAGLIIESIETIDGVEKLDNFDSNGWQWDWWQGFTHGGKEYCLAGSGHHGGHAFGPSD